MPFSQNSVVIACAGSGKTTRLVNDAIRDKQRRIAIISFTNNNVREIISKFGEVCSGVPKNVDVMSWFGFLIRECARPYQNSKYSEGRIDGLCFLNTKSARGIPEYKTKPFYFAEGNRIYSDKLSKFVFECENLSGNSVTKRLRRIYTDIYVDEFQDLSGWDWDFICQLLSSGIRVTLVGDPRQHIYQTNVSPRNKQYLGVKVIDLVKKWERKGLCQVADAMNHTYRCNQAICDFANGLWPGMEPMVSITSSVPTLQGVFIVGKEVIADYIRRFQPQVLRYNKNSASFEQDAINYGASKGMQFDHVLIAPTGPIKKYLESGDLKHLETAKDKLHVAVTRAKHSVGFAFDGDSPVITNRYSTHS